MLTRISELESLLQAQKGSKRLVLAAAQDSHALDAASKASLKGFIHPVLVGDHALILQIAQEENIDIKRFPIIHEPDVAKAVETAVRLVHDHSADILMKGACSTSQLLKGVLNREWGLRKGALLSHFALFEIPAYHKLLAISDVAINIAPTLEDKIAIIQNAVDYLRRLGIHDPGVAIVAAVETVNDQMVATTDAEQLVRLNNDNHIKGCRLQGPLSLDAAINRESALHKNLPTNVAGDADLLIMPDIEAGNVLYKALAFLTDSKVASVVLGASAPIVLTSRSDSEDAKLNSILLAAAVNDDQTEKTE